MLFKWVFNLIALIAICICGFYTTLYSKLSEDIEELKDTMRKTCGKVAGGGASKNPRSEKNGKKKSISKNQH